MLGQIELSHPVAKLVVDESRGEFREELAAQRLQSLFDVHAVLDDAIQYQIADHVVVEGPGEVTAVTHSGETPSGVLRKVVQQSHWP
jgi:hypothetical protein